MSALHSLPLRTAAGWCEDCNLHCRTHIAVKFDPARHASLSELRVASAEYFNRPSRWWYGHQVSTTGLMAYMVTSLGIYVAGRFAMPFTPAIHA